MPEVAMRNRARRAGPVAVLLVSLVALVALVAAWRGPSVRQPSAIPTIAPPMTTPPAVSSLVAERPTYDPVRWPTAAAGAPPPPAAVVARGAALYDAHCASCHGAHLEGQPDWKHSLPDGSLPAPPHDTSGHTWHHGDGELLRIIGQGGTIYMPNSKMPGFAGTLSDYEMRAVLAFIKTFWGAKELSWQANVTAGEVGPGTAP